ncbi:MAG: hypothetical protein ACYCW6_10215 [Candidatus Xenobia bacterium]
MISLHDFTQSLIDSGVIPPNARERVYLPNGRPNFRELLVVLQEEKLLSPTEDAEFLASPDLLKLVELLQKKGKF